MIKIKDYSLRGDFKFHKSAELAESLQSAAYIFSDESEIQIDGEWFPIENVTTNKIVIDNLSQEEVDVTFYGTCDVYEQWD